VVFLQPLVWRQSDARLGSMWEEEPVATDLLGTDILTD
jgi:hypothetical protein